MASYYFHSMLMTGYMQITCLVDRLMPSSRRKGDPRKRAPTLLNKWHLLLLCRAIFLLAKTIHFLWERCPPLYLPSQGHRPLRVCKGPIRWWARSCTAAQHRCPLWHWCRGPWSSMHGSQNPFVSKHRHRTLFQPRTCPTYVLNSYLGRTSATKERKPAFYRF